MISRTVVFASLALALLSCLTETVHAQIDRSDVRLTTNLIDDTRRESGNRLSNGRGESSSFVMSGPSGEGTNIRGESGSRRESGNRLSNGRGESSSFVMSGPSGEGTNLRGESGSRSESFGDSRRESGNRLSNGRGDSGSRLESFGDSRRESGTRLESFGDSRRESSNRFSNNRDENMASSNLFGNSGRDSTMRGDRDFSSISSGSSNRDSTLTGFSGISRPAQTNENRDSSNRVNGEIINAQRDDKFRGRPATDDNNIRNTHPMIDDSRGFHSFYEKPRGPYPYRTMYNYHREPMYHPHGGYGYGPYRPGRFHNGYRGGYGRFRRYSGGDPEEHFFYGNNWNV